jgi:beta-lactamase superfamily II metal-dependent hydrolase
MLVDTGPDDSILYELPKYMPENDRTIEVVLLTHSHVDHIQGLFSVLNNYEVKNIIYQSDCFNSEDFEYVKTQYKKILHDMQVPFELKYKDIDITSIYPFDVDCHSDVNQDSIVLNLSIYNTKILLMGDAGMVAEDYLLKNNLISNVDILKAGHHCSRTATSDMFLSTVSPSAAICSCGEDNSFGHPHSETIQKFENQGVQYLITYETGNIVFKFKKP